MVILVVLLIVALVVCLCLMASRQREAAALRRVEKMRQVFLHSLSHQIRTPLHSVSGLAGVIADDTLYLSKSEKRNISDQIKYNTNLIATLFDEMMMFAGDSDDGHVVEHEELSPNIVCRRCMETGFQQTGRPGLRLHFKRELSDEFFIHTDSHILEVILTRLLQNAYRFTEEGEIIVGCNTTENPDRLTIYVQDTGAGIPEERKDSLFSWFEHPEDMKDEAELDLSVAQRLADRLGGVIRLDPFYHKGTRLMLILPLR